jgi:hypothetical protein
MLLVKSNQPLLKLGELSRSPERLYKRKNKKELDSKWQKNYKADKIVLYSKKPAS